MRKISEEKHDFIMYREEKIEINDTIKSTVKAIRFQIDNVSGNFMKKRSILNILGKKQNLEIVCHPQ